MSREELFSMLWCPTCQDAPVSLCSRGELRCEGCGYDYAIRHGHPVLVPEEAWTSPDWSLWREHLEKFRSRRGARVQHPDLPLNRAAQKSRPQPRFAEFTRIREGVVLDVGCGPGKFRLNFDESRVRYVGLDPLVLPDARDFSFVQALAEFIPFKDDTFTDVVVLAALDHFRFLDRFMSEAQRVLVPGGRLHILQSVHQVSGPVSALRAVAHWLKDAFDERLAGPEHRAAPKHMSEFTRRSLNETLTETFRVVATERYSSTWYSPEKLFLSLEPKAVGVGATPAKGAA